MTIHSTAFSVSVSIETHDDQAAEALGRLVLDRSTRSFTLHRLDDPDPSQFDRCKSPASGWASLIVEAIDNGCALLVGPGVEPLRIENAEILPAHWQVFSVGHDGIAKPFGAFLHPLEALAAAKSIHAEGGCPAVMSPVVSGCDWEDEISVEPAGEVV